MKTKLSLIIGLLISTLTFAQQGINYKALVKDASGNILANTSITVDLEIKK